MRPSSRRFSTCFVLAACSRVCVHRRVVIYCGHFLLRYSHGTFFRNLLNVLRRLRPPTCVRVSLNPRVVTSSGHFYLRYCNTLLLIHLYSLQHPLLLMLSLSLFATSHPKEGSHWQSVFCRYKDRSPKCNCNSTRDGGQTGVPNEPCRCLPGNGNSTRGFAIGNPGQRRVPRLVHNMKKKSNIKFPENSSKGSH